MRRRCEPLYEGDSNEYCGVVFDDMYRLAVCPHYLLAGGDTVGIGPKSKRETLDDVAQEFVEWARGVFGDKNPTTGSVEKFRQESKEFLDEPSLEEAVDCVFVLLLWKQRSGYSHDDFVKACRAKLEKNKLRRWGTVPADEPGQHLED